MNQQTTDQQRHQQNSHQQKHKHDDQSKTQQTHPPAATAPTQSQIYDNLRRIGELEDKKLSIQNEIESRTVKLRGALNHVATDSLLYKMLASVLGKSVAPSGTATKTVRTSSRKKTSVKKKASSKQPAKKASQKKKAKKRSSNKKRR